MSGEKKVAFDRLSESIMSNDPVLSWSSSSEETLSAPSNFSDSNSALRFAVDESQQVVKLHSYPHGSNPLYPKEVCSIGVLQQQVKHLVEAYSLLLDIKNGKSTGYHASHLTHREVVSLRAALEGTKVVSQEWFSFFLQERNAAHCSYEVSHSNDSLSHVKCGFETVDNPGSEKENKRRSGLTSFNQAFPRSTSQSLPLLGETLSTNCAARTSSIPENKMEETKKVLLQLRSLLTQCETAALSVEDAVENTKHAKMRDPVFDVDFRFHFPATDPKKNGKYRVNAELQDKRELGMSPCTPTSKPWPSVRQTIRETTVERLKQLLSAGFFNFFVCCPFCVLLTIVLLLFFPWYVRWVTCTYLIYILTVGRPRFPLAASARYRHLPKWRYFRDYFPVRQIFPEDVRMRFYPTVKNYIFCYHPHAAHAFGALATFGGDANGLSSLLPGIQCHLQTLSLNFFVPGWRELLFWMGMGDASSWCIRKTLTSGHGQSVVLAVGGAEESFYSRPRTNDIVLTKRKGFIRIALETGSSIVPVYGFGETDTYESLSVADSPLYAMVARRLKKWTGILIPMIRGRGPCGIVPLRRPIYVVFGKPIDVPKILAPTAADIEHYHALYSKALINLYEEYCGIYGLGSKRMHFVK